MTISIIGIDIPIELLDYILSYLTKRQLYKLRCVSTIINEIINKMLNKECLETVNLLNIQIKNISRWNSYIDETYIKTDLLYSNILKCNILCLYSLQLNNPENIDLLIKRFKNTWISVDIDNISYLAIGELYTKQNLPTDFLNEKFPRIPIPILTDKISELSNGKTYYHNWILKQHRDIYSALYYFYMKNKFDDFYSYAHFFIKGFHLTDDVLNNYLDIMLLLNLKRLLSLSFQNLRHDIPLNTINSIPFLNSEIIKNVVINLANK